jgi:hypothetical protein
MQKKDIKKKLGWLSCLLLTALAGCEKNIDIDIDAPQPLLVVEAYINNLLPQYNYVVLSRSQGFFEPVLQSPSVSGARVSITEGQAQPGQPVVWNPATRVPLTELNNPLVPPAFRNGVYFDARTVTNPQQALLGKINTYYLLEIETGTQRYNAITYLMPPVAVDSVVPGYAFTDEEGRDKMRLTNHYQDPDTAGNRQLYYWRFNENRTNFGWGGLNRSRAPGTDNLSNSEYIRLTHPQGFDRGDTVNYYMASVTRDVWTFWDSFNKARDNDGPFATPVTLATNINGINVTGCFSGLSLSTKTVVVK